MRLWCCINAATAHAETLRYFETLASQLWKALGIVSSSIPHLCVLRFLERRIPFVVGCGLREYVVKVIVIRSSFSCSDLVEAHRLGT